jgi:N-acetyl-anhydromuramyl-L-alanine amidase AmpD
MSRSRLLSLAPALLLSCALPEPAPQTRAEAPPRHLSAMTATSTTAGCSTPAPKKTASSSRSCGTGEKIAACAVWDPPLSDRCAAEAARSKGVTVDYRYFGQVDCRSETRKKKVRRIVIHNGDHARGNNDNWQCRKSAAHYTIDRDGKIYQHIGEERVAWHANTANADTIGIELQIKRKYKTSCNSLDWAKAGAIAKTQGVSAGDVIADMCGPTDAQYVSLQKLVDDIETRHTIDDVLGHCEVPGTTHADPRAFDWRRIGQPVRKSVGMCDYYSFQAVKGRVIDVLSVADGSKITMDRGTSSGLEVGDHGWLENDAEEIAAWFVVEKASARTVTAVVTLDRDTVHANMRAAVVATPGHTPAALGGVKTSTKPSLGSCETNYTFHKSGTITTWTAKANGDIDKLILGDVGSAHRVCDDSSGMIYLADRTDAYVTDADGEKIRFKMTKVDDRVSTAEITHGRLTADMLKGNKRVVVRKKK